MPRRPTASAPGAVISGVSERPSPSRIAAVISACNAARLRMRRTPRVGLGERVMVANCNSLRRCNARRHELSRFSGEPIACHEVLPLEFYFLCQEIGPHGLAEQRRKRRDVGIPLDQGWARPKSLHCRPVERPYLCGHRRSVIVDQHSAVGRFLQSVSGQVDFTDG